MAQRTIPTEEVERKYCLVEVPCGFPGTESFRFIRREVGMREPYEFVEFYALKEQVSEVMEGKREVLPVAYRQVDTKYTPDKDRPPVQKRRAITLRPITNGSLLESITQAIQRGRAREVK
ncbi:MAG: hypothetical protein KKD18_00500 [Nanoarchaeota archaeon]|nr:hypothetical protein [Nanoarchaeota archaeon]MBU0976879.1 hypothetical protein [Nanoarchaeota archaeon]